MYTIRLVGIVDCTVAFLFVIYGIIQSCVIRSLLGSYEDVIFIFIMHLYVDRG